IVPAWLGFHSLDGELMVKGIPLEAVERLQLEGGATDFHRDPICGSVVGVNTHWWKLVAAEMASEAGVAVRLHSRVAGVERRSDGTLGVTTECRGTRGDISTRTLIDCTDTGEVAAMGGAELSRGRASDGSVQVASWSFAVNGVNTLELIDYLLEHPEEARPFPDVELYDWLAGLRQAEIFVLGAFKSLVARARAEGMDLPRNNVPGVVFAHRGEFFTVASRVVDVDPGDPENLSKAELTGMRQTKEWLTFLRTYVPGFSNADLAATPHQIGLRETNHLLGAYQLTGEDLMAGRTFPDGIAMGAYHLDIHPPDHAGIDTQRPPHYQIPFRALLPREADGIAVAGRAISATHEAMASTRVIPISMALGQAAGTAAALATRGGCELRDLDVDKLREALAADGARVS
ncbi:MAG: FAD-dependent oxidoreductase, partial [Lentisphaerae bacterium]|nr:FAD-dependent oxidoreductase [Lentisphaerota bacterium]